MFNRSHGPLKNDASSKGNVGSGAGNSLSIWSVWAVLLHVIFLLLVMQIGLVALRLFGLIAWRWLLVFAPLASAGFLLLCLLLCVAVAGFCYYRERSRAERELDSE